MAETFTVPGVGPVKKEYAIAGGAAVAGFVGFAWWRRRSAAASAPVYDTSALTPSADYVSPGGNSNIPPQDHTGNTITTNSEWAQKATTHLGNIGYDPKTVASAIGVYFQRKGLTPTEMDAVIAAVGQFGPPPQNGPWAIIAKSVEPAPGGGTGGGTTLGPVTNLRVTGTTRRSISLAWDKVPGAERYQIELAGSTGQWKADFDTSTTNSYTSTEREPDTTYDLTVYAERGNENGPEATVSGRTKK